jgi:transposase
VGEEAIQRLAALHAVVRELASLGDDERRQQHQRLARPLWEQLGAWLQVERRRVADAGATAAAIDDTLKHWAALTHHLQDGAVPIDNNHLERQIKPWAMGRKAWMFVGRELAGQRQPW